MTDDAEGMNDPVGNATEEAKPAKRPYTRPGLIDWGLTQAVRRSGKKDGGRFLVTRTR